MIYPVPLVESYILDLDWPLASLQGCFDFPYLSLSRSFSAAHRAHRSLSHLQTVLGQ